METLNTGFFFVADKLISLQGFFMNEAWRIGRYVLIISLSLAGINYALTGQGLKENIIKIGKALVFFVVIMGVYPRIIAGITDWTFQKASDSMYGSIARYIEEKKTETADAVENLDPNERHGFTQTEMRSENVSDDRDPLKYFSRLTRTRKFGEITYTVVAPAATMEILLLVAGECLDYANPPLISTPTSAFGRTIKGLFCAFAVLLTGIFAMIEYLMAYLEFMLVTGVGIILFPLSIWEGSKFLAEKLIGAIIGFFIKLLFCNICIFLLLYGYISLLRGYASHPFTGQPDEILIVLFVSLLFFYICKSAPALAQSLLTGSPSLSAAGAIGAVTGAVAGGAGALGLAKKAGGALASGTVKGAFAGQGMLSQAAGAAFGAAAEGGTRGQQAAAFMSSIGGSAKDAVMARGSDLARSLLGGGKSGGSGRGFNRHSQREAFFQAAPNEDGSRRTFREQREARLSSGVEAGQRYMEKRRARQEKKSGE